jgi:hypothetical protein
MTTIGAQVTTTMTAQAVTTNAATVDGMVTCSAFLKSQPEGAKDYPFAFFCAALNTPTDDNAWHAVQVGGAPISFIARTGDKIWVKAAIGMSVAVSGMGY